jgi:hypothetical protein
LVPVEVGLDPVELLLRVDEPGPKSSGFSLLEDDLDEAVTDREPRLLTKKIVAQFLSNDTLLVICEPATENEE